MGLDRYTVIYTDKERHTEREGEKGVSISTFVLRMTARSVAAQEAERIDL